MSVTVKDAIERSPVRVVRNGRPDLIGRLMFLRESTGRAKVILPSGAVVWCSRSELRDAA